MTIHVDVAVIGGGQAGLATSYELSRRDLEHVVLDAAPEPGHAWRSRWDSLRLFTPAWFSALPGMPFPGDPDAHPTKDQVADYLTVYADRSDTFITKTPPAAFLLKQAAGLDKGSGEPNRDKVGTVTRAQVEEIARTKMPDLNAADIEGAARIVEGTARSMGITVNG